MKKQEVMGHHPAEGSFDASKKAHTTCMACGNCCRIAPHELDFESIFHQPEPPVIDQLKDYQSKLSDLLELLEEQYH